MCGRPRNEHRQANTGADLHCPLLPAMKLEKPWRQSRCPFCGLKTFFNDVELKVAHEAPECRKFLAVSKQFAPQNIAYVVVES